MTTSIRAATEYAEPLGLPADVLPGQAHLNPDSGYGDWPSLLDWCLEPSADTSTYVRLTVQLVALDGPGMIAGSRADYDAALDNLVCEMRARRD